MNINEKNAKKTIDTIKSLREKPGVEIYVDLTDLHNQLIKIHIEQYGKEILTKKINLDRLSETTREGLLYEAVGAVVGA